MAKVYLRLGDDDLDFAQQYPSVKQATTAYQRMAVDYLPFKIKGELYFPAPGDVLNEQPDIVLSLDDDYNVISKGA